MSALRADNHDMREDINHFYPDCVFIEQKKLIP